MRSWKREPDILGESRCPRLRAGDDFGGEGAAGAGRGSANGEGAGSAKGLASCTGVRAGPDRIMGIPLTGLMGVPKAYGALLGPIGSDDCD